MRITIAIALSTVIVTAQVSAETLPTAAPVGGVVYRLPPQEFNSLLEKRAEERAAQLAEEKAQNFERRKLSKSARVGAGVLGFLGNAAAETARGELCGVTGARCAGSIADSYRTERDPTRP
jgi:GGDEF domain-containing protein